MKTKSIHQNRFFIWRAPRQDEVNMFDNVDALSKLRQTHTHTQVDATFQYEHAHRNVLKQSGQNACRELDNLNCMTSSSLAMISFFPLPFVTVSIIVKLTFFLFYQFRKRVLKQIFIYFQIPKLVISSKIADCSLAMKCREWKLAIIEMLIRINMKISRFEFDLHRCTSKFDL